jgi:hypothetical protein
MPGRSGDHKQDLHDLRQNARTKKPDYIKRNVMSVRAMRTYIEAASDPLRAPSTYQRGVVPKYLKKRFEASQKEDRQCKRFVSVPACPSGDVILEDSHRKETLIILKERNSCLVQELRMMPFNTDIRMMYSRKVELTKKLKETEEAINVFSKPKVCVELDA